MKKLISICLVFGMLLVMTACHGAKPSEIAIIPKVNETER